MNDTAVHQRIAKFHAHLDICSQCEQHPFALCSIGAKLLKEAAMEKPIELPTLTKMLNEKAFHYESMDEGAVIYVEEVKQVLKEWLKTVGLPNYFISNGLNATEATRRLLITLVDEP